MDRTDDANLNSIFSAIRSLLIVAGTALAAHGLGGSHLYDWIQMGAGSTMVVGPAVWGVISAVQNYRKKKAALVQGVNAGMALAASGNMLVKPDGTPVQATSETAPVIAKVFAPEPAKV